MIKLIFKKYGINQYLKKRYSWLICSRCSWIIVLPDVIFFNIKAILLKRCRWFKHWLLIIMGKLKFLAFVSYWNWIKNKELVCFPFTQPKLRTGKYYRVTWTVVFALIFFYIKAMFKWEIIEKVMAIVLRKRFSYSSK